MRDSMKFKLYFTTIILYIIISLFPPLLTSQELSQKSIHKSFTTIGPYGGLPIGLVTDLNSSDIMYSAILVNFHAANLYKTTNGGENWYRISPIPGFNWHLVIDPNNPEILYYNGASNIFKSTDGGYSWSLKIISSIYNISISEFKVKSNNSNIVYGCGSFIEGYFDVPCFFKSVDGGETCDMRILLGASPTDMAVDPENPDILYIANSPGVTIGGYIPFLFRSTDGGNIWVDMKIESAFASGDYIRSMDVDSNSDIIMCFGGAGIYKSTDRGENWTLLDSSRNYLNKIECLKDNPDHIFGTFEDSLFTSTDGGSSWSLFGSEPQGENIITILPLSLSEVLTGRESGIYKTVDKGITWDKKMTGIVAGEINSLTVSRSNPDIIFAEVTGLDNILFKTSDRGTSWNELLNLGSSSPIFSYSNLIIDIDKDTSDFVCVIQKSRYISYLLTTSDGGASWKHSGSFPDAYDLAIKNKIIFILYRDNQSNTTILTKSTDSGSTWNNSTVTTDGGLPYSVTTTPHNDSTFFISGYYNSKGTIFKSTNGGSDWNVLYEEPAVNIQIYSVCADPADTNILYYYAQNGIFKSTDNGNTWNNIYSNICSDLHVDKNGVIYGLASNEVIISKNGGVSFDTYSSGITSTITDNCLEIDEMNGILYVGTDKQGVMSLRLGTETRVENSQKKIITGHRLFGNYPNPFNQGAGIRFQVSGVRDQGLGDTRVKLAIYNILGQHIRTLVDEEKPEGTYRVYWDGRDKNGQAVPSGVYFYRLQAGDFSEVKKMILLK